MSNLILVVNICAMVQQYLSSFNMVILTCFDESCIAPFILTYYINNGC